MAGLYLHIPFCRQACSYCDFYFVTRQILKEPFVDRLCEEIDAYAETLWAEKTVDTIYLGGGTPSLLTLGQLERIFGALDRTFRLKPKEVTIELNPENVEKEYLSGLKSLGIHRASMGIQSFDSGLLESMHRAHTAEQAHQALRQLRDSGFDSFNVDLIYGQPGQQMATLDRDLDELLAYAPPHLSAYSMTIEPGTRLGRQVEIGRITPAAEEKVARQFHRVEERLAEAGMYRYEVSNFSRPGREALHNRRYWSHFNYLGLGPSAHSFWWDQNGAVRWQRERDLKSYLSDPLDSTVTGREELTLHQLAEERIMLGLRTLEGVSSDELETRYDYRFSESQSEWLRSMNREGYLMWDEPPGNDSSPVRLTGKGLPLTDRLTLELLHRH